MRNIFTPSSQIPNTYTHNQPKILLNKLHARPISMITIENKWKTYDNQNK